MELSKLFTQAFQQCFVVHRWHSFECCQKVHSVLHLNTSFADKVGIDAAATPLSSAFTTQTVWKRSNTCYNVIYEVCNKMNQMLIDRIIFHKQYFCLAFWVNCILIKILIEIL